MREKPRGKFRVVSFNPLNKQSRVVDGYEHDKALQIADKKNGVRNFATDVAYFVYNDKGEYLRGPEAVSRVGVSP